MSVRPDLARFLALLRRYLVPRWPAVALLVASSYVATVLAALLPLLMAPILDLALGRPIGPREEAIGLGAVTLENLGAAVFQWLGVESVDDRLRAIALLCLAYVGIGALRALVEFANYLLALWIRVRAAADMQVHAFQHLLGLSMRFFTRARTGELVSRMDNDTRAATYGLETIAGTLLTAPALIAVYGWLLVRTSPRLVMAALVAVVLHWLVTRAVRGPIRRLATEEFSIIAERAARLQEAILSIRVVKSLGAEALEVSRLRQLLDRIFRVSMRFGVYKHGEEPARALVAYAVEAGLLLLAASELLSGRLGVPTFFLFLWVGRAAVQQVGVLSRAYTSMQTPLAAAGRVSDLLAEAPEVRDGAESITTFTDRLVLHDVSFDYGGERVLDRVSLEIRRGEMVALVGPSGVGKSTLADLVLRLYDPVEGTITIDGRDLTTLRQADYRRLFGVVSQEALLFNAPVRDNIAYGREGVTPEDVERAARIANAHEFILELPQGYDTPVGDRGVRLSGGQRQRLAMARALVARPQILVLDEATSSLDSESERLVQQTLDRVVEGMTSIAIAHRLSTVLGADTIVVLNRGRVEAIGRHADLLTRSETYARLYRLQFAEPEPAEHV
jgi:ATP-binding cassette, subfamily B, bacterial MsbA